MNLEYQQHLNDSFDESELNDFEVALRDAIVNRAVSVLITGPGGCGKSHFITHKLIPILCNLSDDESAVFANTATSGVAARNNGGQTLEGFVGVGLWDAEASRFLTQVRAKSSTVARLRALDYWIIDEVSMLSALRLNNINFVLQHVRESHLPFGGVCMIFCGDFLQLAPVVTKHDLDNHKHALSGIEQRASSLQRDIDELRHSTADVREFLMQQTLRCSGFDEITHGMSRSEVEEFIARKARRWTAIKLREFEDKLRELREVQLHAEECAELSHAFAFDAAAWKNAGITVFTLNVPKRFADMKWHEILTRVRIGRPNPDDIDALMRCMNATFPDGIKPTLIDPYVRTVDNLNASELAALPGRMHEIVAIDAKLSDVSWDINFADIFDKKTPRLLQLKENALVMCTRNLTVDTRDLVNGMVGTVRKITIMPHDPRAVSVDVDFSDSGVNGGPVTLGMISDFHMIRGARVAERRQLPLKLAFAMTVHKAQGSTLSHARANIDGSVAFTEAIAYVALSRVRSIDGLQLSGFSESAIRANPRAVAFYDDIARQGPRVHPVESEQARIVQEQRDADRRREEREYDAFEEYEIEV